MILYVDAATRRLTVDGVTTACVIGRSGAVPATAKREGDGFTPAGTWRLREAFLRPDRVAAPATKLPWRWLSPEDGWSDDPADPDYNRFVRHPHPFSAEHLWREDGLYDVVVALGYNDTPPVPGHGSAIFLHCAPLDGGPTAGCVAVARDALVAMLPWLTAADTIEIAL